MTVRVISKVLELDGAGWGRGRRRFASPRGFVFPEGGSEGGRWGRPGRAAFLPPSSAFLPMGATGTEGIWDSEKGEGRG